MDSGRLRQILLNLIGNAVKFAVEGGVSIEVRHLEQNDLQDEIALSFAVCDSGPGLAEDDQKRIFEEFVQTDEGATRKHGGAGLGLAISKNLVELMGGQIEVVSQLGRGTVFKFQIPTCQAGAQFGEHHHPQSVDCHVGLIIDKSPARRAFVLALRGLGAQVSTFDSPQAFQMSMFGEI